MMDEYKAFIDEYSQSLATLLKPGQLKNIEVGQKFKIKVDSLSINVENQTTMDKITDSHFKKIDHKQFHIMHEKLSKKREDIF